MDTNPSNILYRGECPSMREAFGLMVAQYRREIHWIRTRYLATFPEETDDPEKNVIQALEQSIRLVHRCQEQYHKRVSAAEQVLAAEWLASEDEEVQRIGEALKSGDYSLLAL